MFPVRWRGWPSSGGRSRETCRGTTVARARSSARCLRIIGGFEVGDFAFFTTPGVASAIFSINTASVCTLKASRFHGVPNGGQGLEGAFGG